MLTIKQIGAVRSKDKPYRLLNSNGLYLYVPASGKKVWQLRYKIDGEEKGLTVGKYPLCHYRRPGIKLGWRERMFQWEWTG